MDKTEKFFYLPQATNASFVPSPSDGPSCTPEPLEPEPEGPAGPAGSYPCPCCGCLTFPVPKEEAIAYICPVCFWENDVFDPDEDAPSDENRGMTLRQGGKTTGNGGPCGRISSAMPGRPGPANSPCKPLNKGEPHVCSTIFSSKARGRTT